MEPIRRCIASGAARPRHLRRHADAIRPERGVRRARGTRPDSRHRDRALQPGRGRGPREDSRTSPGASSAPRRGPAGMARSWRVWKMPSACYFVHSFHAVPERWESCLAETRYGDQRICAVARSGNLYGMSVPSREERRGGTSDHPGVRDARRVGAGEARSSMSMVERSEVELEVKYGLPREVVFCRKCVISNQRPTTTLEVEHDSEQKKPTTAFDANGVCDACRYAGHEGDRHRLGRARARAARAARPPPQPRTGATT